MPKWLWFLGCGCGGMVIAMAIAAALLWNTVKDIGDEEIQWPALAAELPVDEPFSSLEPKHLELIREGVPGK